ncbi:uncharacterized protein SCHCODRAFT_01176668 [Schizophyllum commune H4-8]|nr:uncharacterized protein SCHCODRAFT_01176668 [Schizophyllum commune H4-8]KAI5885188.1 hypothetical protein SCHCODRAFT_01176668 [Schizophyllum commune H4-8]
MKGSQPASYLAHPAIVREIPLSPNAHVPSEEKLHTRSTTPTEHSRHSLFKRPKPPFSPSNEKHSNDSQAKSPTTSPSKKRGLLHSRSRGPPPGSPASAQGNGATIAAAQGNGATIAAAQGNGATIAAAQGNGATIASAQGNGATIAAAQGNGATIAAAEKASAHSVGMDLIASVGMDRIASGVQAELVLAIYEVGQCFFHSWGVPKDMKMGVQYYTVAARLGDADAQADLGDADAQADLGDADAQADLGFCLAEGKGCKKDRWAAVRWYRAAVSDSTYLYLAMAWEGESMGSGQGLRESWFGRAGREWIYKEKYQ